MNVQELLDELNKITDKTKVVVYPLFNNLPEGIVKLENSWQYASGLEIIECVEEQASFVGVV